MRLRKKPWIEERIASFADLCDYTPQQLENIQPGAWHERFARKAPLHVELGSGKGRFITQMALRHPPINYLAIEAQKEVAYYIAVKTRELELTNVRVLVLNIERLEEVLASQEADRFYINFCDPWPKARHAKRRLTHTRFLHKYRTLLKDGGDIHFKTDNRALFDFSLRQFAQEHACIRRLTFDLHADADADAAPDDVTTEYEEKFSLLGAKICRCEVSFS